MKKYFKTAILMATILISFGALFACSSDDDGPSRPSAAQTLIGKYEGSLYPGTTQLFAIITSAGGDKVNITYEGKGTIPASIEGATPIWASENVVQVQGSVIVMYDTNAGEIQISKYMVPVYQFNGKRGK